MQTTRSPFVASILLVGVVVACLPAARLRADGLIRDGIGAISVGRGGTNLGFADNATIIHDNPAAMTNIAGTRLMEVGIDSVITDLHYTDPDNRSDAEFSIFPSGVLGYVHRNPSSRFAFGFGAFAPAGFGAKFRMDNPHMGKTEYMSIGALAKALPSVAMQVTDRLSIGGAFGVAIGHVELEGPFYTQSGPLMGMPCHLDLQSTGATTTWNVGTQYILSPSTTIGLAYTEETRFNFEGKAGARLMTPGGVLNSQFDADSRLVWPRSLGLGIKHALCDCRRLGFDFYWYDWSDSYDSMKMRLYNPTHPALAGQVINDAFPMNWRDTYSFRFGYEWDTSESRVWRTGYVYHRSPVPDATLNPYTDGVLEHAVSIGRSHLTRHGVVNLAYQFTWGPKRHVGESAIVGDDFSDSTFAAAAHWLSISWTR